MSISGPQALAALDDALRDIRREENEILRKLVRGLDRAAKLREGEAELLRQRAGVRLAPAIAEPLSAELLHAATAMREALKRRTGELAQLTTRLHQLEAAIGGRTTDRAARIAAIDQHQSGLRTLAPRIAAAVARAPAYEQQRQGVLSLKAIATAARAKSRQADFDREQKGRPFRHDPLFGYLLERGFDTPTYRGRGLTRILDGWVAGLVDFPAARLDYEALNALPAQLRLHAQAQEERAAEAEDRLDDLEQEAVDAAGGNEMRTLLAASQAQIAAIDGELASFNAERDSAVSAQTRLTVFDDEGLSTARQTLVQALAGGNITAAEARARTSPGDDTALQLEDARLRLAEEEADAHELHTRLATLAHRRRELQDIESDLKRRHFDDPRSLFRDAALTGRRLDDFLTGVVEPAAYLGWWHDAQAWIAGTSDWGGGIGLPRHGREPSGASDPSPAPVPLQRTATEFSS